jgi:hypothetical protein
MLINSNLKMLETKHSFITLPRAVSKQNFTSFFFNSHSQIKSHSLVIVFVSETFEIWSKLMRLVVNLIQNGSCYHIEQN